MLKKSASGVLASLRGSTYHRARAAGAARGGWVKKVTPRLGHCRLTVSPARTDVALFLHRAVRLAAALPVERRVLARRGREGENSAIFEHRTGWTLLRTSVGFHVAAVLFLQACASPPNVSSKVAVAPLPPPKTMGSLWQEENGRAYLYEDLRAMRIGDILTVKIVENHKGSKSADTEAQRESTIKNSLVGSAMGYIGIPGIRFSDETRRGMGIDASATNKFGGKGATSREGTLTGTISAIVTEVLPNGDLRVEGRREVTVNSEKQLMSIGGIVRRVDVDTKNTVLSSAIADARIEYSGLGVLDDVQRPGWFIRILDWVYPF